MRELKMVVVVVFFSLCAPARTLRNDREIFEWVFLFLEWEEKKFKSPKSPMNVIDK